MPEAALELVVQGRAEELEALAVHTSSVSVGAKPLSSWPSCEIQTMHGIR